MRLQLHKDMSALDAATHPHRPNHLLLYSAVRRLQNKMGRREVMQPVCGEDGVIRRTAAGIAAVHRTALAAVGVLPHAPPGSDAARRDDFVADERAGRATVPPPSVMQLPLSAEAADSMSRMNRPITMSELLRALDKCNAASAPGEDQISYRLLKLMDPSATRVLLALYNLCLCSGVVPAAWCTAMVKPLFKGNVRMDPLGALDVNNYRGISLTSCVGKLLEKIVALRIEQHVGAHAPLSETRMASDPNAAPSPTYGAFSKPWL